MSNPNEKVPPVEQQDNLFKTMEPIKQSSSDSIQWITEPAVEDQPKEEPVKFVPKEEPVEFVQKEEPAKFVPKEEPVEFVPKEEPVEFVPKEEPFVPTESTRHSEEPGPSSSKPNNDLAEKVRAVELDADDEEDVYKRNPPQIEKDDNGFQFYKCRFCGLTFNFMTTLKAHERVHNVEAPYACTKCSESFHFMCELEYHAKTHEKQKGYKCDCGRTFHQYTDFLYHYHPGEDEPPKPLLPEPEAPVRRFSKLPIEPTEFPTPGFAENGYEPKHQMRVYSEVRTKPYICQYCSKSYSDSRQLAYHMYGHRGERMFNPRASRYLMARNDLSYISPGVGINDTPPYV